MNRSIMPALITSVLALGIAGPRDAVAQTAKDLVGSWTLVSIRTEQGGNKVEPFGPQPKGALMLEGNGRFSIVIVRPGLPKFAANSRMAGTPEENKAVVQGSLAYFGTYSVSEADKTLALQIEGSTFPNWEGADQKRQSFTLAGDELKYVNPTPSTGMGTAQVVWKRAR